MTTLHHYNSCIWVRRCETYITISICVRWGCDILTFPQSKPGLEPYPTVLHFHISAHWYPSLNRLLKGFSSPTSLVGNFLSQVPLKPKLFSLSLWHCQVTFVKHQGAPRFCTYSCARVKNKWSVSLMKHLWETKVNCCCVLPFLNKISENIHG